MIRSIARDMTALLRFAVVMFVVFVLATGTARTLLVELLTPESDHVCACSLEAGHKYRCLKCLGDAHAEHDDPERTTIDDESCGEDDAGGLAKCVSALPVRVVDGGRRPRQPIPDGAGQACPQRSPTPEPPPPIGAAHDSANRS